MEQSPAEISELLRAWSEGDDSALEALAPMVYQELRRLAQRYLRGENRGHSLQATALANEAWMRLAEYKRMRWQDRSHFFAVAAQAMRRILVEHARKNNLKRGKGMKRVTLDEIVLADEEPGPDLVALDDALNELAARDQRKARVVELRFFGGLSVQETAEVLRVSPVTVMRDWALAKAWLYRELGG